MASTTTEPLSQQTATTEREFDSLADLPTPSSPSRQLESAQTARSNQLSRRHSKRLSLNFPILVPTQYVSQTNEASTSPGAYNQINPLPTVESSQSQTESPVALAPSPLSAPLSQPTYAAAQGQSEIPVRRSSDFLTLLASQERRVLELKEELHKAEAELLSLKKN